MPSEPPVTAIAYRNTKLNKFGLNMIARLSLLFTLINAQPEMVSVTFFGEAL